MIDYWLHLTPTMKMFVGIGTVSSAVLTLQMVLAMFGGDMDGLETDVDIPDAGEGGASGILSIRTIGAFFTGFGWSGAAMLQAGHGTGAATFVGIVVGSIFMALIFYLMTYLHSLRQEGTINYANAVGKIGSVYLPIPPHRKGIGQVEVLVQGRLKIVQAITDNDKKIGNRVAVRVTELVDTQTILVEPLENESPKES